jgi:hypothetical protein
MAIVVLASKIMPFQLPLILVGDVKAFDCIRDKITRFPVDFPMLFFNKIGVGFMRFKRE